MSESKSYSFPSPIYGRIVDAGYFDYDAVAADLTEQVTGRRRLLELCAGNGKLAIRLASAFEVVALDNDQSMLTDLRKVSQLERVIDADATEFAIDQSFDVIYEHSGHIIGNRYSDAWAVDVGGAGTPEEAEDILRQTLTRVAAHLVPGGLFLLNVESWGFLELRGEDGSLYQRTIEEQFDEVDGRMVLRTDGSTGVPLLETRLHVFSTMDDSQPTKLRTYHELIVRRPKVSAVSYIAALRCCGLSFVRESRHFLVARKGVSSGELAHPGA